MSLSDPEIFVGFISQAKDISCPMAVIALETVEVWTRFPLP